MGWLPLFSLDTPFLRAPGIPGKCGLCDQGAEMSLGQKTAIPPAWEVPALRTTLEGKTPPQPQVSAFPV